MFQGPKSIHQKVSTSGKLLFDWGWMHRFAAEKWSRPGIGFLGALITLGGSIYDGCDVSMFVIYIYIHICIICNVMQCNAM